MLENLGVGGAENGEVCFIRRGSGARDWGVAKVDTGVREITHIDGDKERLVIGSRSDIQVGGHTFLKMALSVVQLVACSHTQPVIS